MHIDNHQNISVVLANVIRVP